MPTEYRNNWPVGMYTYHVRDMDPTHPDVKRELIGLSFVRGTDSVKFGQEKTTQFRYFNSAYFIQQGPEARALYADRYLNETFYSHRDAQAATLLFARDFGAEEDQEHHAPVAGIVWALLSPEQIQQEQQSVHEARENARNSGVAEVENLPIVEIGAVFHRHEASLDHNYTEDGIDVVLAPRRGRGFHPLKVDPKARQGKPIDLVIVAAAKKILDITQGAAPIIIARIGDDNVGAQRLAERYHLYPTRIEAQVERDVFEKADENPQKVTVTEHYWVGVLGQEGQMIPLKTPQK